MKPEPVHRCESCGVWIPRDPNDEGYGPPCPWCAGEIACGRHIARWEALTKAPRMWPAMRVSPSIDK